VVQQMLGWHARNTDRQRGEMNKKLWKVAGKAKQLFDDDNKNNN